MAIKLKPIRKRCPDGELYVFINGVAEVPGIRMGNKSSFFNMKPLTITLKEFNTFSSSAKFE